MARDWKNSPQDKIVHLIDFIFLTFPFSVFSSIFERPYLAYIY